MAGGAVSIAGIGHVMRGRLRRDSVGLAAERTGTVVAFQADGKDDRALEQSSVCRTVRGVAGFAAIDADGRMFEQERPALVGVAFHAGLFVLESGFDHPRTVTGFGDAGVDAVRIVAIRARHEAFIDSVLEGLRKLGADIGVAAVTDIGLFGGKQIPGRAGLMDRVARGAYDIGLRVRAAPYVGSIDVFRMAAQTGVEHLIGLHERERVRNRDTSSGGGDMLLPCPVTGFAAHVFAGSAIGDGRLEVGISEKLQRLRRVARAAAVAAGERGVACGGSLCGERPTGDHAGCCE